jgi:hypothetical protein
MTNIRWIKWAITRHFKQQGLKVRLAPIILGNATIDGEVIGDGWKMALELKTPSDDIVRGLGQIIEALAYGYDKTALVTILRKSKRIDLAVFDRFGLTLLGIDSKANVHEIHSLQALRSPALSSSSL